MNKLEYTPMKWGRNVLTRISEFQVKDIVNMQTEKARKHDGFRN